MATKHTGERSIDSSTQRRNVRPKPDGTGDLYGPGDLYGLVLLIRNVANRLHDALEASPITSNDVEVSMLHLQRHLDELWRRVK